MKKFKKLLAVMLAAIMVMSIGSMSVSAASTTYDVTITNVASTSHTFSAYQIFAGDYADGVLSNVTWGSSVSDAEKLVEALKASTKVIVDNEGTDDVTLSSLLTSISYSDSDPNASAAAIAEALSNFNNSTTYTDAQKEALAQAFADVIMSVSSNVLGTAAGVADDDDYTGTGPYTYTISNLSAGYYLITDSTTGKGTGEVISDYMLQVVKNVELASKSDVPTIEKTVSDASDGTYSATSTASYGDTVYYKIRVTVPDISDYESYSMVILDTLSDGLHFNSSSVVVTLYENGTASTGTTIYTDSYTVATDAKGYANIGSNTFAVVINDILEMYSASSQTSYLTVSEGYVIEVTYTATLEDNTSSQGSETYNNVNVGNTGNANTATLVYSNNPNETGTGTSTPSKTTTYTTSLTVTKVDGSNSNAALKGATFQIYKKLDSLTSFDTSKTYVTYNSTTGTVTTVDTSGTLVSGTVYYVLIDTQAADDTNDENEATFSGLDAGTYLLVESVTPSGYNTADPIEFTVSMTSNDPPTWSGTTYSGSTYNSVMLSSSGGTYVTTIQNNKGSTIPVTGGMGTTILYIIGAILVISAAVILVTRRRMANK